MLTFAKRKTLGFLKSIFALAILIIVCVVIFNVMAPLPIFVVTAINVALRELSKSSKRREAKKASASLESKQG